MRVPATSIVVGDIVCLCTGDQIKFHGVLFHANQLAVSEWSLSGVHEEVRKNTPGDDLYDNSLDPFVFRKTRVTAGTGIALVLVVGETTQGLSNGLGDLPSRQEERIGKTNLDRLGEGLNRVATLAGAAFSVLTLLASLTSIAINGGDDGFEVHSKLVEGLLVALIIFTSTKYSYLEKAVRFSISHAEHLSAKDNVVF